MQSYRISLWVNVQDNFKANIMKKVCSSFSPFLDYFLDSNLYSQNSFFHLAFQYLPCVLFASSRTEA